MSTAYQVYWHVKLSIQASLAGQHIHREQSCDSSMASFWWALQVLLLSNGEARAAVSVNISTRVCCVLFLCVSFLHATNWHAKQYRPCFRKQKRGCGGIEQER